MGMVDREKALVNTHRYGILASAMKQGEKRERLSRSDWIDAALTALADGGLDAIAVVPLAGRLGVTKGSFYWHFRSLDELIEATLAHWAVQKTSQTIRRLDEIADPRDRLRALMTPPADEDVISRIDIALSPHAADPRVASWLRRHDGLWLDFAARAYKQAGFSPKSARNGAVLAYSAYLGLVRLVAADPAAFSKRAAIRSYITFARDRLVPT